MSDGDLILILQGMLRRSLMTCTSGDGDPYITIRLPHISDAHVVHDALLEIAGIKPLRDKSRTARPSGRISQEELHDLFGEYMPMKVAELLMAGDGKSINQLRDEIYALAEQTQTVT